MMMMVVIMKIMIMRYECERDLIWRINRREHQRILRGIQKHRNKIHQTLFEMGI
jgi:hypothetical protein